MRLVLFILSLCLGAESSLTEEKIQKYINMTRELLEGEEAMGRSRDCWVSIDEKETFLIGDYVLEMFPKFEAEIHRPAPHVTYRWYQLVNSLCLDAHKKFSKSIIETTQDELCPHLEHIKLMRLPVIHDSEIVDDLISFEEYINESTTFVRPVLESTINYLFEVSNATGPNLESCKSSMNRTAEKVIKTSLKFLENMRNTVAHTREKVLSGELSTKEKKSIQSSLLRMGQHFLVINCEYADDAHIGNERHFTTALRECAERETTTKPD